MEENQSIRRVLVVLSYVKIQSLTCVSNKTTTYNWEYKSIVPLPLGLKPKTVQRPSSHICRYQSEECSCARQDHLIHHPSALLSSILNSSRAHRSNLLGVNQFLQSLFNCVSSLGCSPDLSRSLVHNIPCNEISCDMCQVTLFLLPLTVSLDFDA